MQTKYAWILNKFVLSLPCFTHLLIFSYEIVLHWKISFFQADNFIQTGKTIKAKLYF